MIRHLIVTGAAAAALTLAACDQNRNEAAVPGAPDANPAATVPTPANEAAAPDYIAKAAASDMFEVEAAKIAQRRAAGAEVKAFADMMAKDHAKSTADMKAALTASGLAITPPAALPDDLRGKIDALNSVEAADFDRAYMEGQVDAHQNALNLHTRYAQDGDNPELKAFAAQVAPVIQGHYDRAVEIRDALAR